MHKPANVKVNGHLIVADEQKFHIYTEGIGYWAFNFSTFEDAQTVAQAVHAGRGR